MVRKLLKSLLSLSLIAPLSAFALGLGDVHLHSALSERLQADIDLLSVSPGEADSITVSLASQETFDKVGLDRPAILMFLKFEVVKATNGEHTIKVTSVEPINEPYLDFLVEVEWKSGRVLREYTLLLDPPSGYREAASTVMTPDAASTAGTTSAESTGAPSTESAQASGEAGVDEVMAPASPDAQAMAGTPAPEMSGPSGAKAPASTGTVPLAQAQTPVLQPAGSIVYGPVKAGDTLWNIAEKLRPNEDVSVQQMMMALVKANPYAFIDNNINRLKRGFVLRVDDPGMLTAMSKSDAIREVARQTRAWQDYRESVASRAKQRPEAASAVESGTDVVAAVKSEPKLKLVTPEGKGVDSAAPSGTSEEKTAEELNEELMLALESSAAQRKENQGLKERLSSLEGQLSDMENILTLKDADLAALQEQLHKQGQGVELPAEKAEVQKPGEQKPELVVKADELAKPEEQIPAFPGSQSVETQPAETKPVETKPVETKPAETKPAQTKPVEAAKPKPVRKPVAPPPPEPTIIDMLMDNLMYVIGGVVTLLLLVILVIFAKRRRKGGFQESILNAGSTSSMMKASDEQGSETSFLSDLAISGMGPGTIQTDEGEADPITEAEVFMAYGRNQQAEEVLKKAREISPDRTDIAAKLLEVYYNSKDSEKFEALAEEAVGALQADDALWGSVLAMGHELCPNNVLFEAGEGAEAPAAVGKSSAPAAAPSGDVMDIGLDLDELSAEMEGEGGGGDMDLDLGLDFGDLEESSESEETGSDEFDLGLDESVASAEEGAEELEMDLGALAGEEESTDEGGLDFDVDLGGVEEVAEESTDAGLDFDLDLGSTDEAVTAGDSGDIELDMGDLDVADSSTEEDLGLALDMGELTTEADEGAGDMSLDMDLDMDLGSSAETVDDSVSMDLDTELDELGSLDDLGDLGDLMGDSDEISQKLDLAQAYAEMGDAEGARSMLEEVVSEGNDEQKQQAQALIDKL